MGGSLYRMDTNGAQRLPVFQVGGACCMVAAFTHRWLLTPIAMRVGYSCDASSMAAASINQPAAGIRTVNQVGRADMPDRYCFFDIVMENHRSMSSNSHVHIRNQRPFSMMLRRPGRRMEHVLLSAANRNAIQSIDVINADGSGVIARSTQRNLKDLLLMWSFKDRKTDPCYQEIRSCY